jgi:carbamoyl-phosphate synthase large subunit
VKDDQVYLIEVNPRAARTVPFVSKATGVPLAKVAARIMTGKSLADQGLTAQVIPPYYSVKEVVLPFNKFPGVDPLLGPEMRSTGEVMGVGKTFPEAFAKAEMGANTRIVKGGRVLLSVRDSDKHLLPDLGRRLINEGFELDATHGTAQVLTAAGVPCRSVKKVYQGRPNILDYMKSGVYNYIINTTEGRQAIEDSKTLRRGALQFKVAYTTTIKAALACADAVDNNVDETREVHSIQELHALIKR